MGETTSRKKTRLLRHDRVIVANELRSALSSWSDRLIALTALVFVLTMVRFALAHKPFLFAATAVAGVATVVGAGVARLIERRMDFHSQDGVLAADALADNARRQYALPIHAVIASIVTICAAIGRPSAVAFAPIGYLIGALVCHVAYAVVHRDAATRGSVSLRTLRRSLQRPLSGVVAAVITILLVLVNRSIDVQQMAAVVALVTAAMALVLTMLDYHVIRFMTESGYSAARIIGLYSRPVSIFLILTVIASTIAADRVLALIVFGVVVVALLFMASRILAYRMYSKRTADTLLTVCGIVCASAVAMPLLLPVLIIVILWQLYPRSVRVTSLLP